MAQQKGMKRAAKVANRKRKVNAKTKLANLKRAVRQAEATETEAATA
jgi:hypothetical protein